MMKNLVLYVLVLGINLTFVSLSMANGLTISNVTLEDRNASSDTVIVEFDLSWENSWLTKINHDAVWLTIRLYDATSSPTDKKLVLLTQNGLNPSDMSIGSNDDLDIYIPADMAGVFVRRSSFSEVGNVTTTNVRLKVNYASGGFADNATIYAGVIGMEMVYVPEGSFYSGDYNTSTASLHQGSADSDPWHVTTEVAYSINNAASNGFRYVSNSNPSEDSTGTSFSLPAAFPKGYQGFYCMKYEVTEGQWVEFVNSLPSDSARSNRDLTNANHKNSDSVLSRNTISCSGTPLTCSTSRPDRAVNYLSWMDLSAYLDWMALRPMTELEFEKAARGPRLPALGEYSWGTTEVSAGSIISGTDEDGSENITTDDANANFNNTTFTGGDTGSGVQHAKGPVRVGIFATSATSRVTAGASYYGVMELSGNVSERAVTIGNADGRSFSGTNGDGYLVTASGYEGNADVSNWPGLNAVPANGVTGADGSGFKGGSWQDASTKLQISDRSSAALISATASATTGGRGVRTYDGE